MQCQIRPSELRGLGVDLLGVVELLRGNLARRATGFVRLRTARPLQASGRELGVPARSSITVKGEWAVHWAQ